ncbi:DNA excision repair protein ERCC-6-like 2 isoform X2 [Carcharodon carcharias]|uniref:DNA excision repair protein ERCC-6-like 2 isoform X2 n=1 Tax=Carcharodon carcharias TaxID=13397 RepID=UPI001B7F5E76|nr:DNA excision repair protein ERCC-6-like 2 isoform X2 [Carcharodon carcharias]
MEQSVSASESNIDTRAENWFVGDQVLAPFPGDDELYEATIKSISTGDDGRTVAVVRFSSFNEETVAISALKRKSKSECWKGFIFDDDDLEKPFFHDKKTLGPKVSFKLSEGSICIPYTINRYLRDYQRDGVQFICRHYFRGGGCILGDDMGLGKTVQVISFLAAVLQKTGTREDIENNMPKFLLKTMRKESKATNDKIFLIIAPLSLLYNWKDELDSWGYFRVCILHGNQKDHTFSCIRRRKCEIALTTYETVRLCSADINCIEWSAVFVDEAHKIKNPKAQITQTLKALKCKVRIGLTGTILQNNMDELWCVMDWAVPGCLGNRAHFKEEFCNPIEFGQRHTATKRELAVGRKSMRRLAKRMSFWFLRRTKALISDQLPKKDDRVIYCSLTEFQKMIYKAVLETEDIKLVLHGWNPCNCNSGRKRKNCCYKQNQDGCTVRQIYFSYLAILRKVSNHVALLQPDENTSKMQASTVRRVCEHVFCKFPEFAQQSKEAAFMTISDPKYSGKMKVLQRLLDHCRRNQEKILLFSLSTKLLDVLERYCMSTGLDYRRLDGKTKTEERIKIVKEFNSTQDINICLVSTMAGGLGLNFVGANIVVIFDPTWNPANDLQAIDRAYRIGQCRDVKVFRLISLGTIEEIMYLRQLYKQQLHCAVVGSENAKRYFNAVQGSKEHYGELFGIQNLFGLRTGGSCLTRDIIQRTGQLEAGVLTAATQLREEPPATRLETDTGKVLGEENNDLQMQPNKGSKPSKRKSEEFSDFSSDSETEPSSMTKMRSGKHDLVDTSNNANSRGQLTLAQCGFSKLLDRKTGTREEFSESDWSSDNEILENQSTEESTSNDLGSPVDKAKYRSSDLASEAHSDAQPVKGNHGFVQQVRQKLCQNWSTSSESEGEAELRNKCKYHGTSEKVAIAMTTDNGAEGSDDVIHPSQMLGQKKKVPAKKKSKSNFLAKDSEDSNNKNFTSISCEEKVLLSCKQSGFPGVKAGIIGDCPKITKGNPLNYSAKLKEPNNISDESDDIEISADSPGITPIQSEHGAERAKKTLDSKSQVSFKKETMQYNIEEFSSSEDDVPTKRIRFSANREMGKSNNKRKVSNVQFGPKHKPIGIGKDEDIPGRKNRSQNHGEQFATMDRLLGDVQEVAFIHSNQHVIGSSKAENQMSHNAIRDVFELKQYSQIPANVAVHTSQILQKPDKVLCSPPKSSQQHQTNKGQKLPPLPLMHPVTQTERKVHRAGGSTFLIGQTSKGICRKQLSEMAELFNSASVEDLAERVLSSTLQHRLTMLSEFYTSQNPELSNIMPVGSPESALEDGATVERSRICTATDLSDSRKKNQINSLIQGVSGGKTKSFRKEHLKETIACFETQNDVISEKCDHKSRLPLIKINKMSADKSFSSHSVEGVDSSINMDFSSSSTTPLSKNKPNRRETSSREAVKCQQHHEEIGPPTERSKCKSGNNQESMQSKTGSITELLGDTSILDTLFGRKKNHTAQPRKTSGNVPKGKRKPKDFWDVLNQSNNEYVSTLTDLSVIESLCESAPLKSKKREEKSDGTLWKKNEKFLWKKGDPKDDSGASTSGTFLAN